MKKMDIDSVEYKQIIITGWQKLYDIEQKRISKKQAALVKVWSYLNDIEEKDDVQQKLYDEIVEALNYRP